MDNPVGGGALSRERIRLLFAHAPQVLLGGLVAAVILALVIQDRADPVRLGRWLVAVLLLNGLRFGLVAAFRRRAHGDFHPLRWGWAFAVGSGGSGLLWGLGFYWFFKPDALELILLTLVLGGLVSGSVASLSAFLPAYLLFVACSVGLYIGRLLAEPETLYHQIAGFTVLFSLTNLLYARNAQDILVAAIQLRLDKEALAGELNRQVAATEAARERAERANLEKSQLLAATSHDLRQPVHAQALYLEILKQDLAGRPEAELVERISEAGRALGEMLESLLEISRIEAGGMLPDPLPFPLDPLLLRLSREFMPEAHVKNLRFAVVATRAWCHSDPLFIERILRNLIANALRYTQRGGIVVGCRRRGDRLLLQVWDSGIGIPLDQQAQVFREFHQLANPERDRRKGLGLGLAIVDRLCRLLDHPIRVVSRPGRGSLFECGVPAARAATAPADQEALVLPDLAAGLRVLVLDDDPVVLDAAGRILARLGCRAWCVGTPAEAGRVAAAVADLQVLLVDYRLPGGVSGVDVARTIHAILGRAIPTAIITGDISPDWFEEARRAGFSILHKPLDGSRFRALLASLAHAAELAGAEKESARRPGPGPGRTVSPPPDQRVSA